MRQIWCGAILGETLREIVWQKQSCFIVQCLIMFLFTIYWFSTQGILLENKSQPTLCLVIILESDPSHGHSESKIFHAFVNHCILKKQNWVLSASHECQHIIPVASVNFSLFALAWQIIPFNLRKHDSKTKCICETCVSQFHINRLAVLEQTWALYRIFCEWMCDTGIMIILLC